MSPSTLRRAAALGLVLTLAVPAIAAADTVFTDGDAITPGNQMAVHLGEVAPGASVPVDVALRLTCKNSSHVAAGSMITVTVAGQTWPGDGSATWTAGGIDVPADWPAPGAACPGTGQPTTLGATPVHLDIVAPTTPGTGYIFSFLFSADPGSGVTNLIAFDATVDVVDPVGVPPTDSNPPVLHEVPAHLTVLTAGSSAIVIWPAPTATDDTDPAPQVSCDPASGSSFPLGASTVTCTATDAAGNAAVGTFNVTVRQLSATWGRPLDGGAFPALTGRLGRTIPLKLTVLAGDAARGPGDVTAPALRVERLAACAVDAAAIDPRSAGSFRWDDGAWHLNLRTALLGPGCWHLVATVDGADLAAANVRLDGATRGPGPSAAERTRGR